MIRHSTKSLTSAKWLGTVAGIAGALLVALNVGATIVGIGFSFFAVSAVAWVVAGWRMGEPSLIAMHGTFLAINLLGIWRCLPASEKRQGTKLREAGRVLWGFDCGDSDGGAWIA